MYVCVRLVQLVFIYVRTKEVYLLRNTGFNSHLLKLYLQIALINVSISIDIKCIGGSDLTQTRSELKKVLQCWQDI